MRVCHILANDIRQWHQLFLLLAQRAQLLEVLHLSCCIHMHRHHVHLLHGIYIHMGKAKLSKLLSSGSKSSKAENSHGQYQQHNNAEGFWYHHIITPSLSSSSSSYSQFLTGRYMNTLINLHNMVGLINLKIDLVRKFGCPWIIELKTSTLNTIWRKYFHVLLVYDESALSETTQYED